MRGPEDPYLWNAAVFKLIDGESAGLPGLRCILAYSSASQPDLTGMVSISRCCTP
jgi:hypothetical protein